MKRVPRDLISYNDKEIIESIKKFYEKHGRVPKRRECNKTNGIPTDSAISDHFGNFTNAIIASGFKPNKPKHPGIRKWSDEELIGCLKRVIKEAGFIVTEMEYHSFKKKTDPVSKLYRRRFKKWKFALKLTGVKFSITKYRLRRLIGKTMKFLAHVSISLREKTR